jgi:hypothetical protein
MKPNSTKGENSGSADSVSLKRPPARDDRPRPAHAIATSFGKLARAPQVGLTEHAGGIAARDQLAGKQQRFGVLLANVFEIVQYRDYRSSLVMPVPDQRCQITNTGRVDRAIGFVEQDQRGVLQHDPGKQRALQLAAGERTNRPLLQPAQANAVDRLGDAPAPSAVETQKGTDLAPQTHGHEVMDGDREAAVERRLLAEVGDLSPVHAEPLDAALQRPQFAGNPLEQRRLAGPFGPTIASRLPAVTSPRRWCTAGCRL